MFVPLVLLLLSTSSAADHKRLLLHNDVDVAAAFATLQQNMTDFANQVKQLESKIVKLESKNSQLEADNHQLKTNASQQDAQLATLTTQNQQLQSRVSQLQTATQQNGNSGSVYVRWGRNVCPGNGSDLIYNGIIGGTFAGSKGGGSNSLCLPEDPTWNKYIDSDQGYRSAIYGTEIEDTTHLSTTAFGFDYNNQDPPCATCHTSRASVVMIPGRQNCYPGWTREYTGYLVGGHPTQASSDYICLDSRPEKLPHGLDSNSNDQHILYFVEARCGSLPCPPYHEGREIACVVCSK